MSAPPFIQEKSVNKQHSLGAEKPEQPDKGIGHLRAGISQTEALFIGGYQKSAGKGQGCPKPAHVRLCSLKTLPPAEEQQTDDHAAARNGRP